MHYVHVHVCTCYFCVSLIRYAFIRFQEEASVNAVIDGKPHVIDGKTVDLRKAIPHDIHQVIKHLT